MSLKYLSDKICVPSKTEYTYSNVFNIITEEMNKNPQFCMFHVNARVNSIYRKKVEKLWIACLSACEYMEKCQVDEYWKTCTLVKNTES